MKVSCERYYIYDAVILIMSAFVSGITHIDTIFFIGALLVALKYVYKIQLSKKQEYTALYFWTLMLLTIIMPNPYVVYVVLLFMYIYYLPLGRNKIRTTVLMGIGLIIINVLINGTSIMAIALSIFYCLPIYLCYNFIKMNSQVECTIKTQKRMISLLKLITWVEFVCIPGQFFEAGSYIDLDRISGTFGLLKGEGMTLLMYSVSFVFFMIWNSTKKSEYLFYFLLNLFCGTIDGCVGLTFLFLFTMALYLLMSRKISIKYKVGFVIAAVLAILLFIATNADWVIEDVLSLADYDYLLNRVGKLKMYMFTFWDNSRDNIKYALFGNGIGQYTSRAAMTMTGQYADWYSKLGLPIYTNVYAKEKVLPWLVSAPYNGGIAAAPFSEYITIFGEFGLIGLLFIIYLIIKLWKKSNKEQKLLIMYWIIICFYNNYLEYGLYVSIFVAIYYILGLVDKMERN